MYVEYLNLSNHLTLISTGQEIGLLLAGSQASWLWNYISHISGSPI